MNLRVTTACRHAAVFLAAISLNGVAAREDPAVSSEMRPERSGRSLPDPPAPVEIEGPRLATRADIWPMASRTLDRAEIARRAPASAAQLLQGIGGAYLDQAVGPGGFSSLYLRGADPSATLVLVDGVRVNDATNSRGGAFDFGQLDPASIERIEIVPGAQSAIYGPDAIAGVVNIVTRRPPAPSAGFRVRSGAGGSGHHNGLAEAHTRSSAGAISLGGSVSADGPWESSSRSTVRTLWSGISGAVHGVAVTGSVRAASRHARSFPDDSGGTLYAVRRSLDRRDGDIFQISLAAEQEFAAMKIGGHFRASEMRETQDSAGVAPGVRDPFGIPPNRLDSRYRRDVFGMHVETRNRPVWARFGIEHQREAGRAASELQFGSSWVPTVFARSRSTRSLYAEGRAGLAEHSTVHGALRADWVSGYAMRASASLSLSAALPEAGATAWLRAGTGFKPPSFYALSHPIVGNPDLMPETSTTAEAGFERRAPASALRYSGAVFAGWYGDLVDFEDGPPPRLVNRGRVVVSGVDASVDYRARQWNAGGALTVLDFDLPTGQPALRNRPRTQARIFGDWRVSPAVSLTGALYWQSRIYDSSIPTGALFLPSAGWIDLAATGRVHATTVRVAVDNALDKRYQRVVGFPALSRRIRVELEVGV